jgi:hypothetical protein
LIGWILTLLKRRRRPRKAQLLVMHLDDMIVVHPQMIEKTCSRCSGPVGVYPSGQDVLRRFGEANVRLVCNRCQPLTEAYELAPGALTEPQQSVLKKRL